METVSMRRHLWWLVPGELAGMPRPSVEERRWREGHPAVDAFDDDVKFLSELGVRSIISALELPAQREVFQNCGFHYFSLRIPDGCPPTPQQADQMLAFYKASPLPLAVHCVAGVGRTGTLLATILLHRGFSAQAAVRAVRQVMPPALETGQQVKFVYEYEKLLMSRTPEKPPGK
jgi:atypical dual specificity phosphatase